MERERSTSDAPAPQYVFVLVDIMMAGSPMPVIFWTRADARARRDSMPPGMAANYKVRRAKLTVFNK